MALRESTPLSLNATLYFISRTRTRARTRTRKGAAVIKRTSHAARLEVQ